MKVKVEQFQVASSTTHLTHGDQVKPNQPLSKRGAQQIGVIKCGVIQKEKKKRRQNLNVERQVLGQSIGLNHSTFWRTTIKKITMFG